jgi:hypothetical protein
MKSVWNSVQRWVRQSSGCTIKSMGLAAAFLAILGSAYEVEAKN